MRHTAEVQKQVKKQIKTLGVIGASKQFDIPASTLYNWIRKWKTVKTENKTTAKKKTKKRN
jgi:transposase-like protein